MRLVYHEEKNTRNIRERGLSFERALDLDWSRAHIWQDRRKPYPETRMIALAYLDQRLHVLCYTVANDALRVISFRKANQREIRFYEKQTQYH